MKKKFVYVKPVSANAKDRFINDMDSFHSCVIEEENDDMMHLASINQCYYFWLPKEGNEHWKVISNK